MNLPAELVESFRFAPDPAHAQACDRAMHAALADSLRAVCDASAGKVPFDRAAMDRLIAGISAGTRLRPAAFGLYYELVPALVGGDTARAAALFEALARETPLGAPFRMLALGQPELADCAELYLRAMNSDEQDRYEFLPPSDAEIAAFRSHFAGVMDLLQRAAPELAAEIRMLVSELVLVVGPPRTPVHFDGGSSYQLWGALFLNAVRHKTRIDVIESLAHESAHSRLFGLCIDEPTVRNPDEERYPSPLRREPRPMDGVYHATFVSARMHWTMCRLLDSGLLDAEEAALARAACAADRLNFDKGYATVAAHADLTPTGRRAIGAAYAYMQQAA